MIGIFRWNRQKSKFGRIPRSIASASNDRQMFAFSFVVRIFRMIFGSLLQLMLLAALLYPILAAPPLHWFYPVAAPAGPASVYVAGKSNNNKRERCRGRQEAESHIHTSCVSPCVGAGFPGFWFHLGLLQSLPTLKEHDFYCFSSGCLSKSKEQSAAVPCDVRCTYMANACLSSRSKSRRSHGHDECDSRHGRRTDV